MNGNTIIGVDLAVAERVQTGLRFAAGHRIPKYVVLMFFFTACVPNAPEPAVPSAAGTISLLPSLRDTTIAAEVIEVPKGFHGTGIVIYGQPGGEIGLRQADTVRYILPVNGTLRVESPEPWGYTAKYTRVRGEGTPIKLFAQCRHDAIRASPLGVGSSGCWLPRVLINASNTPAYVAFLIGPRETLEACAAYGISTIMHVVYGDPLNVDSATLAQCH